jgi:hypothetical protein
MRPVRSPARPKQHRTESKGRPSLPNHSPVIHIACRLSLKRNIQPVASCFWQVASSFCLHPPAAMASLLRKHVLFVMTAPPPCHVISIITAAPADLLQSRETLHYLAAEPYHPPSPLVNQTDHILLQATPEQTPHNPIRCAKTHDTTPQLWQQALRITHTRPQTWTQRWTIFATI